MPQCCWLKKNADKNPLRTIFIKNCFQIQYETNGPKEQTNKTFLIY